MDSTVIWHRDHKLILTQGVLFSRQALCKPCPRGIRAQGISSFSDVGPYGHTGAKKSVINT